MLKIGLTGGIASGKSAVANLLAKLGACIIDTDLIAREVVQPGETGLTEVISRFGGDILLPDGTLDRDKMRKLIFSAPEKKAALEGILHPLIRKRCLEKADIATQSDCPYIVFVVPLLAETDFDKLVDRVAVVDVQPECQLQRLMQRDAIKAAEAERIIDQQVTRTARLQIADDIIDNNGSLDELRDTVAAIHAQYLELAAATPAPKY